MTKRLIFCSDGTWNTPAKRATNVLKMFRAIASEGTVIQKKFYDEGVGTEGSRLDRLIGGASGRGLNKNIQDGYRFLMHTYEPDDEIYLFGFSRGAYTVRSLAGFLRNCGLLKATHAGMLQEAFDLYRREDAPPDSEAAVSFREAYSHEVKIHFLGVWDTVGALGIPTRRLGHILNRRHQFHDVELSGSVKHAYHALAIDERRRPFKPSIWEPPKDKDERPAPDAAPKPGQHIEQVWFAGYHSDVGGGTKGVGLSNLTFDWMVQKAKAVGLDFNEEYLASDELKPNPAGPLHDSTGIFRFFSTFRRSLGRVWHKTEAAHPDVLKADGPQYNPKNLIEYKKNKKIYRVAELAGTDAGTDAAPMPAGLRRDQ